MNTQRGMTTVSFLILVFIGIILLRGVLVVAPIYFDDTEVGIILDNMEESGKVNRLTPVREVRAELARRLMDNDINISADGVQVSRTSTALVIDWTYENRGHFLGNIDMVLTFHKHKEITK